MGEFGLPASTAAASEAPQGMNVGGIGSISRREAQPIAQTQGQQGSGRVTIDPEGLREAALRGRNFRNEFLQGPYFSQLLERRQKEAAREGIFDAIARQQSNLFRKLSNDVQEVVVPNHQSGPFSVINLKPTRLYPDTSGSSGQINEFTPASKVIEDLQKGLKPGPLYLSDGRSFTGRKGDRKRYSIRIDPTEPAFRRVINEDPDAFQTAVNELAEYNRRRFGGQQGGDPSEISNTVGSGTLDAASTYYLKIVDQNGNPVMVPDPATGQPVQKTRRVSSGDPLGTAEDPDQTAQFLRTKPITRGDLIAALRDQYTTEVLGGNQIESFKIQPTDQERIQFSLPDGEQGTFEGMIDRGRGPEPYYRVTSNDPTAAPRFRVGSPTKYAEGLIDELADVFGIEYKGIHHPTFNPFDMQINQNWTSARKLADLVRRGDIEIYQPGERIYDARGKRVALSEQEVFSQLKNIETMAQQRLQALRETDPTARDKRTLNSMEVGQDPILFVRDKRGLLGRKSETLQPIVAGLYPNGELFVAKAGKKYHVPAIFHPESAKIRRAAEEDEGVNLYGLIDEMAAARVPDPDDVSKAPYSGAREQLAFEVQEFSNREGRQPNVGELVDLARALAVRRSGGVSLTPERSRNRDESVRYSAPSTYWREAQDAYGALLDMLIFAPKTDQPRPRNPKSFPERRNFGGDKPGLIKAEKQYGTQIEDYEAALEATKQANYGALRQALGFTAAPERADTRVSEAAAQAAVRALDEEVGTAEHDALMRAIGASLESRKQAQIADDLAGLAPVTALPMESFRGNQAAYLQNLRASYGQDAEVRALTSRQTPQEYIEQAALDVPLGAEVGPRLQTARIAAADRLLRRYAQQRRDAEYIGQQDAQVARYGQPVTAIAESMALSGMERLGRTITRDEALTLRDRLVDEYAGTLAQQDAPQEALSQLQQDVTEGILEAYARFNPNKPRMEQLNEEAARQQAGAAWQPPSDDIDASMPEGFELGVTAPLRPTEAYDLGAAERDAVDAELDRSDPLVANDVLFTDPAALQSLAAERMLQRAKEARIRLGLKEMGFPGGQLPPTFRLEQSASVRELRPYPKDIARSYAEQVLQKLRRENPEAYYKLVDAPYDLRAITRE